jgi:hypothetical protein
MAGLAVTGRSIDNLPNQSPPEFIVSAAVSHEEFIRKNPTWGQAKKGPDKEKWHKADQKERKQLTQTQPGRDGPTMKKVERSDVPKGEKIFPIKRHCKIKGDGTYKMRWCVLGNLDPFDGIVFAATAAKKVVWLMFALFTRKGLRCRFFDITGAFMAERPTRDIYVTIDDEVYLLMYSLYGLKDAPKLFQDGLLEHLKQGGYTQSKWDQCLFVKWVSATSYIYVLFHVDDFIAMGTDDVIIAEFEAHLKGKYEVTSSSDGVFLGIEILPCGNGDYIYRKPGQLQSIFDKYLPDGPTMSPPKGPMRESYIKGFNSDDSEAADTTEFRSMLGAVMQLTDVRPDIAFAVSKISQR